MKLQNADTEGNKIVTHVQYDVAFMTSYLVINLIHHSFIDRSNISRVPAVVCHHWDTVPVGYLAGQARYI